MSCGAVVVEYPSKHEYDAGALPKPADPPVGPAYGTSYPPSLGAEQHLGLSNTWPTTAIVPPPTTVLAPLQSAPPPAKRMRDHAYATTAPTVPPAGWILAPAPPPLGHQAVQMTIPPPQFVVPPPGAAYRNRIAMIQAPVPAPLAPTSMHPAGISAPMHLSAPVTTHLSTPMGKPMAPLPCLAPGGGALGAAAPIAGSRHGFPFATHPAVSQPPVLTPQVTVPMPVTELETAVMESRAAEAAARFAEQVHELPAFMSDLPSSDPPSAPPALI